MSKYTVTPWRAQADLLQVRQQLYQLDREDADFRRHAVDRVMAWKLRGNLPHAVESTALLVDAVLHHEDQPRDNHSSFSVRAVYSAAFSRFVTGFCDIGRSKERSLEPSSMLEIARQIDLPVEFVALRHEATHEELPGLRRLAHATEAALQWLWTAYWGRLGEPVGGSDAAMLRVKDDARQALRTFRNARRNAIREGRHLRTEQEDLIDAMSTSCIVHWGDSVQNAEAFAHALVDEKLLWPSKREIGSSLEGAYFIWDGFLQHICREEPRILSAIIRYLLQTISTPPTAQSALDSETEACCLWLEHIVAGRAWTADMDQLKVMDLKTEVMKWSCLYPGYWTHSLGQALIEASGPDFRGDWEDILQASQVLSSDGERPRLAEDNQGVADVDASHGLNNSEAQNEPRDSQVSDSNWVGWTRAVVPLNTPLGSIQ